MSEEQKQCVKCGEWGLLSGFKPRGKQCRACLREYGREYIQRPEVKQRRREYGRTYKREWRRTPIGREKRRRQELKYRESNNGKMKRAINAKKYDDKSRSLPNTFTPKQWEHALSYFNGCCAVCGRQMNDMFGTLVASVDHWIPISYEGEDNPGTVVTNIVPLCHGSIDGCNGRKSYTDASIWLEREFGKHKAKQITAKIQAYFDSVREDAF